jgi:hypothetical protein
LQEEGFNIDEWEGLLSICLPSSFSTLSYC